jgi:uncharacterized protein YecE (DUF72 family)
MRELRIGISGWSYKHWRGVFYPQGLGQKRELEYASRRMNSIEINGTFYSLQRPASFRKWAAETPEDFIFALKGPKYITHMKKLVDVRRPLANFFASGPLLLGQKLGPILWQLPPFMRFNQDKLASFINLLPRTSAEASALATEHNLPKKEWTWVEAIADTRLRYAFEVRHESFLDGDFIGLLRKHNAALVFADTAGKWPYAEDLTAGIVYIRLHGAIDLYASGYTGDQLAWWANRIDLWSRGQEPAGGPTVTGEPFKPGEARDIYVYFDNDINVHAPFDAINLGELLSRED